MAMILAENCVILAYDAGENTDSRGIYAQLPRTRGNDATLDARCYERRQPLRGYLPCGGDAERRLQAQA